MKKVFYLIQSLSTGGAERVVSNLTTNMSDDFAHGIILFGKNAKIDYPYQGEIIILDRRNPRNTIHKKYTYVLRKRALNKIKRSNPGSTIISFLEYHNLVNLATKGKVKTIISVRNYMSLKHSKGLDAVLWKFRIKYLYGKADLIVVPSEGIKTDLVNFYGFNKAKIKVIYNSYPIEEIVKESKEAIEERYRELFTLPVVISVGRLHEQKGHVYLIRAFKKVKEQIPNAKLVILGEGELESDLKQLADDLDIGNSVHFLGFQKNPFKYIARSKLFVLSSIYEGFPNALAEAMACGVPIVATDCLSGPREILAPNELGQQKINYEIRRDRYGVLVPVCEGSTAAKTSLTNREKIMAESIISLLENDDLRNYFQKQSLARIKDFDIKNIIKAWEEIF